MAALPSPGFNPVTPGDRDGDGMPDAWELAHHLDPNEPTDANLDSDGDGLSNLKEFLCGTDPQDPSSALKFDAMCASNGVVRLYFTAVANHSYTIQFRVSAAGGLWEKLADFPATAEKRSLEAIDDAAGSTAPARFYRLVTPALP